MKGPSAARRDDAQRDPIWGLVTNEPIFAEAE